MKIRAGFARVDITPPLGVCMSGYFERREATGILDPLYASAVSISDGNKCWILISCDLLGLGDVYVQETRKLINERCGVSRDAVMIHSTHIHTGPVVDNPDFYTTGDLALYEADGVYLNVLVRKLADVAKMALDDMGEVRVQLGYGEEHDISFIRRFRMKDGTFKTNPSIGNPEDCKDIIEPAGAIDPCVGVVRLRSLENKNEILLVNFALHPDIVGGTLFSADYPGHMRRMLERQLPSCHVMFLNGASGDINHIDAMHPGRTSSGYSYSSKVGEILAGEVLKTYIRLLDPIEHVGGRLLNYRSSYVRVPLREVNEEEQEAAKGLLTRFHTGSFETNSMEDVADVAAAYQTLELANTKGHIMLEINVLTLGELAFVGLPGEVFVDIGRKIKNQAPYRHTIVVGLSNGSLGYVPTSRAFSEGGYERKNSPFTLELEEILVNSSVELLKEMRGK